MGVRDKLIKMCGGKKYNIIKTIVCRVINNVHYKKHFSCVDNKIREIYTKKKNIYFGYYDYPANDENKILYIETENGVSTNANIGIYDQENESKKIISKTNAWNTQMGARLRWIGKNKIIFNDFKENKFISKIIDSDGNVIKENSFPIYDLSSDNNFSFYLNFSVLNYYRPGYGYSNISIDENDDLEKNNGIYKGDLSNGSILRILSMKDIIQYKNDTNNLQNNHYLNHISCSKYNKVIMFFHIWKESTNIKNRVFIIDYSGNVINVLEDFTRASHYCFKNEEELLLTVLVNNRIEYRLYNIKTGKYKLFDFLSIDGHPSYIDNDLFITDTYPDHNGMQHLLLCNENKVITEIAQVYHNSRKIDEYRNDLHPRYSKGILTFDTYIGNYRKENIIEIDLLDKRQVQELVNNQKKVKLRYKVLQQLNKHCDINNIEYVICRLFDFSYNAHLMLNKMIITKSKFKRRIYFNKLQEKYSILIFPPFNIGHNFHMMHMDGITIGSGAIIGDNCTIYQQVTIGKKDGKFPVIGDNVTIYAGAKIVGDVKIGDNAIIGANAVVLKDVPENSVAVGVPARILK